MNCIKVAIGIIIKKNKIYITKGKYKNNLWEFPGGKVEKNEYLTDALKRELLEEVGITVLKYNFFQCINFRKKIKLYFFLIKKWKGKPFSREGYFYTWQFFYNLKSSDFPPANRIVINSLREKISILDTI